MQVGSKSLLPNSLCVRGRSPIGRGRTLSTTERTHTMTGVVFLVCVSALLVGSLIVSSDA